VQNNQIKRYYNQEQHKKLNNHCKKTTNVRKLNHETIKARFRGLLRIRPGNGSIQKLQRPAPHGAVKSLDPAPFECEREEPLVNCLAVIWITLPKSRHIRSVVKKFAS